MLANLKTAGLPEVLAQLAATAGSQPTPPPEPHARRSTGTVPDEMPPAAAAAQQIPRPPCGRRRARAPWPHRSTVASTLVAGRPARRGADAARRFPAPGCRRCCVALADGERRRRGAADPAVDGAAQPRGEISFPGGRVDPGETPIEAALREAHEEVGLDPALSTVVGELDHLNTVVSRSYIVPVVAALDRPARAARRQTEEVDRVLWMPLAELTAPDTYRVERWGAPPIDRLLHFFELDDETVWGATAHMLVDLLSAAAGPMSTDRTTEARSVEHGEVADSSCHAAATCVARSCVRDRSRSAAPIGRRARCG